jgi:hypothetical protein
MEKLSDVSHQKEWGHKWNKKTLTYSVVSGTEDLPKNSKEFLALGIALTTWGAEIDLKFKRVKSFENPDIRLEFKTSAQDHMFEENRNVLAYAYYPGQGEVSGRIVFNEDYLWTMDGKPVDGKRSWNLIHVMIHELGHTLGLMHDEHHETSDVMDPYYNAKMLDLSDWDITRIRNIYPIRTFGGRWYLYSRLKRWLVKRKRRF